MGLSKYRSFYGKEYKLYREYPRFNRGVTTPYEDSKELRKSGYYVKVVPKKNGHAIYTRKGYSKKGVSDRFFEGKLYKVYKKSFERRTDAQEVIEQLRKKGYLVRKVRYEGRFYLLIRKRGENGNKKKA